MASVPPGSPSVTKETSTLDATRPTILDEKRRMERELGLDVEPPIVLPRGSNYKHGRPTLGARMAAFFRGGPRSP